MIFSCMKCGRQDEKAITDSYDDLPPGWHRVRYMNRRNRTCTSIGCSKKHALDAAKPHAKKILEEL